MALPHQTTKHPQAWAACLLVTLTAACSVGGRPAGERCHVSATVGQPVVTTASMLREAADLDALGSFPGYSARLASSTDPASTTPSDPSTWFSDRDRGNFQGTVNHQGRTEYVLLDAPGPGVLTRLWTATAEGTLRVYLDCSQAPAIEVPSTDLFDGLDPPMVEPFTYSEAVIDDLHRAGNSYFPIPYQSHIQVTDDVGTENTNTGAEDLFYQVDYRTYPTGTAVESYAPSNDVAATESQVAPSLEAPGLPASAPTTTTTLGNGAGTLTLDAPSGGGRIEAIEMRPSTTNALELRKAIFVARFDGEETVRVPLGDFFGTRAGQASYRSLAMEVDSDGTYVSRWRMPYQSEASLSVEVPAGSGLTVQTSVWADDSPWTNASLHFHASWADSGVLVASRQDLPLLDAVGEGVYVGTTLSVVNDSACWWGEGDERIWIDGDVVPRFRGTGTEDYFGNAWALPNIFARPYHGQTLADIGRSTRACSSSVDFGGVMSMYRWHVLDAIPFQQSLRFDLEIWHWDPMAHVVYETVSYWYARPGATSDAMLPVAGEPDLPDVANL